MKMGFKIADNTCSGLIILSDITNFLLNALLLRFIVEMDYEYDDVN